jgi:type IV pilus assembly protein PilA
MNLINKGFTIIELMIAVAIIAILAAVSTIAYQNYTTRARAAESVVFADSTKTAVAEYFQSNGSFPTSNTEAGLPTTISGSNTASVTITNGGQINVITTSLGDIAPVTFSMTPIDTGDDSITWTCHSNNSQYMPSSCR